MDRDFQRGFWRPETLVEKKCLIEWIFVCDMKTSADLCFRVGSGEEKRLPSKPSHIGLESET